MKANELRIGNLVESPDGFQTVIEIREKVFYTTDFKSSWAEINPIQLNEQWLKNFDLDCYDYDKQIMINGYTFLLSKIQYVHQLQNLYFALTGEELQIK